MAKICTCNVCRDDDPVSKEELEEVVAAFMDKPRCTVQGKAAQAAVAALCLRELNYCPMCKQRMTVMTRCHNSNCEYKG